jgi:hypothetical protein
MVAIARRRKIWLHVDGAYRLLGKLDPRLATLFDGVEQADSVMLQGASNSMRPAEAARLVPDEELGLKPPVLWGEGTQGAAATIAYAVKFPDRVSSLILVGAQAR